MPPNDPRTGNESARTPPAGNDATVNAVAGIVFALLGAYVVWEAQRFGEYGAVTPAFVGGGLLVLSLALIATSLSAPRLIPPIQIPSGSMRTRSLLVILIVVWVAALPYAGFLLSSIGAFGAIAAAVPVLSNWTVRGIMLHAFGAVIVTFVFWFLLTAFLNVPLPGGKLFM